MASRHVQVMQYATQSAKPTLLLRYMPLRYGEECKDGCPCVALWVWIVDFPRFGVVELTTQNGVMGAKVRAQVLRRGYPRGATRHMIDVAIMLVIRGQLRSI